MDSKIIIDWDSKVTKVKFNKHKFFGKLEFEGIGDLNVITGPNGVGKSRLLTKMNKELKKIEWREKKVFPVYFTFNSESVKTDKSTSSDYYDKDKKDYDEKVKEKVNKYKEFDATFHVDHPKHEENMKKTDQVETHNKRKGRIQRVYKETADETDKKITDKQIKLQMEYELGMSSEDMLDEISILKYLWKHNLIKFENDYETYEDAIDINGHLKNNDFKYIIKAYLKKYPTLLKQANTKVNRIEADKLTFEFERIDQLDESNENKANLIEMDNNITVESERILKLDESKEKKALFENFSSGEKVFFNYLLWNLIHKINFNLKKLDPDHEGLVKNGGKYIFLLGKFL